MRAHQSVARKQRAVQTGLAPHPEACSRPSPPSGGKGVAHSSRRAAFSISARRARRYSRTPSDNRARRLPLRRAFGRSASARSAILSKLSRPLVSQPASVSSALPLQAVEHRRHRAEPGGKIALKLRVDRVLQPHIGAVGMRGIGMHHRRVRPPVAPSREWSMRSAACRACSRLTWNGHERGCHDALIGEVVDLDESVVPVAADDLRCARSRSSAALY